MNNFFKAFATILLIIGGCLYSLQAADEDFLFLLKVYDKVTGKPIPKGLLKITKCINDKVEQSEAELTERGTCLIPLPETLTYMRVEIFCDGYVPKEYSNSYDKNNPDRDVAAEEEITVLLEKGTEIGGTVLDEAGKPVSGANIKAWVQNKDSSTDVLQDRYTKTDPAGNWAASIIPENTANVSITVSHPNYMEFSSSRYDFISDPGSRKVFLDKKFKAVMEKGVDIAGTVVDENGNPISEADIYFSRSDKPLKTDSKGMFSISNVNPKYPVELDAYKKGYAVSRMKVVASKGMPTVNIVLGKGVTVGGKVIDKDSFPIPGVNLKSSFSGDCVSYEAETGKDGIFKIENYPANGEESFDVFKDGYIQYYSCPIKTDSSKNSITLYRKISVKGKVTDAETKKGVSDYSIYFHSDSGGGGSWSERNSSFSTDISSLSYNEKKEILKYVIDISAPGFVKASKSFDITLGSTEYVQDFELRKATGLTGKISLPDGKPAIKAAILFPKNNVSYDYIFRDNSVNIIVDNAVSAKTDDKGCFKASIPETDKQYSVFILHESGFERMTGEEFAKNLNIQLKPWARIEGRIANLKAGSIDLSSYFFCDKELSEYSAHAEIDENGRFTLEHLPYGPYAIGLGNGFGRGEIKAGETLKLNLGAYENKVRAKLLVPDKIRKDMGTRFDLTVELISPYPLPEKSLLPENWDKMGEWEKQGWFTKTRPEKPEDLKVFGKAGYEFFYTSSIDADGNVVIGNIPPGKFNISIDFIGADGMHYGVLHKNIEIADSKTANLDIGNIDLREDKHILDQIEMSECKKDKSITGIVSDEKGNPLAGSVLEKFERNGQSLGDVYKGITDSKGAFTVRNLPSTGELSCDVIPPDKAYAKSNGHQLSGDAPNSIVLFKSMKIYGSILDAETGKEIPEENIYISIMYCNTEVAMTNDGSIPGKYECVFDELDSSTPEEFDVTVSASSPDFHREKKICKIRRGQDLQVDIKLSTGTKKNGLIFAPDGAKPAEARILLCPEITEVEDKDVSTWPMHISADALNFDSSNNERSGMVISGKDGKYSILPPKEKYLAVIVGLDGAIVLGKAEFEKMEKIVLEPWSVLEGTMKPIHDSSDPMTLVIELKNPELSKFFMYYAMGDVNDKGYFRFPNLLPGYYEMNARDNVIYQKLKTGDKKSIQIDLDKETYKGPAVFGKLIIEGNEDPKKLKYDASLTFHLLLPAEIPPEKCLPGKWGSMSEAEKENWFVNLWKTNEGLDVLCVKPYMEYCLAFMEKDNSFKFEDVRPGNYELRINIRSSAEPDMKTKVIKKRIVVNAENIKDNKIDLGNIFIKEEEIRQK